MVKKVTLPDEDGAVELMCDTTDDISTWPTDVGAGSTMTIFDKTVTPNKVSGYGLFDGSVWSIKWDSANPSTVSILPLNKGVDSIDVAKMSRGGLISQTALGVNAAVVTTTSVEFSLDGFNSCVVTADVSAITSGNWVIEVQGSPTSGGAVGQYVNSLAGVTPALTLKDVSPSLNANGRYNLKFYDLLPFNKLVCTRTTDGTLSCQVTPFNS